MWFRLRLSPTHEFTAFFSEDFHLYWDHLTVENHFPNYRNHQAYPLKMVMELTDCFMYENFTDKYLKRLVLDNQSFESLLKHYDPTLYAKLTKVLRENEPITILPGTHDIFSWETCLCIEPSTTGKFTIQNFFRVFDFRALVANSGKCGHVLLFNKGENPWKYLEPGSRISEFVDPMMEVIARRKLAKRLQEIEEDGESDTLTLCHCTNPYAHVPWKSFFQNKTTLTELVSSLSDIS